MCSLEKESWNEWCAARPEDFRKKVIIGKINMFYYVYSTYSVGGGVEM